MKEKCEYCVGGTTLGGYVCVVCFGQGEMDAPDPPKPGIDLGVEFTVTCDFNPPARKPPKKKQPAWYDGSY